MTIKNQFGFTALSATGMAAPAFAAAASGAEVTRPITIEGQAFSLARLYIEPGGRLDGLSAGELETRYEVSLVLLRRDGQADFHPAATRHLEPGDLIAVLGGLGEINRLLEENQM